VIALDDGDGPAFLQERAEVPERSLRVCKMLQYKTDKDMVEALRLEREVEDIPCRNVTLFNPWFLTFSSAFFRDSEEMSTEVIRAPGLFFASITVWAPVPHPASSTREPAG
jgi:hypothetical protein